MASQDVDLFALNRGEVSELSLARVDNQAMRLSAEVQENFLPRVIGPMMLRPGTSFVGETLGDQRCRLIPFVFSGTDTAIIELTPNVARFWVNDALITRGAVATVMNNFVTGEWAVTNFGLSSILVSGILQIANVPQNGTASVLHMMTIGMADQTREHALRIVVDYGPIDFRIGTTAGGQEVFASKPLKTGTYSITFTPNTGAVYIQFSVTNAVPLRQVSFIGLDAPGVFTLPTTFTAADLPNISFDSSADVVFMAAAGQSPTVLSRYSATGWGIGPYQTIAGPFPATDGDQSIIITTVGTIGNVGIVANRPFFSNSMIGQQIRLAFDGDQTVQADIAAPNTFTDAIRVSGISRDQNNNVTRDRFFYLVITGTWTGTLSLQRSVTSADAGFTDVGNMYGSGIGSSTSAYFSANVPIGLLLRDDFQNVIAWYRIGLVSGGVMTGTAHVSLFYPGGSGFGYGRITTILAATSAIVEVLKPFTSQLRPASGWRLSEWSKTLGFPSVVQFHEGRLWFASGGRIFGSVSDQFFSFDDSVIGDSGEIDRSIGSGPITFIRWLLSSYRLEIGGDTSVTACRSDTLDTPLTPTNFALRAFSTIGTAPIQPVKADLRGFYVEQSGRRVFQISFTQYVFLEQLTDVTRLNLDIGIPGFAEMSVMREPDTRVMLVRKDGQVAILLTEIDEGVNAWFRFVTDGLVENVVTLPGVLETRVYYVVNRTINGVTKRYLERCARIDECQGATISKCADCHSVYQGAPTTVLVGLGYLEGKKVVVWGDGKDQGTFIVTGGQITLPVAVLNAVVGLGYGATFRSAKLAYAAKEGTAINKIKRIDHIGLLLSNTHCQGVQYGTDASNLNSMPLIEGGVATLPDTIYAEYDEQMIEFPGQHSTDSRVHITATAPRPATVMGVTLGMTTSG